MSKEKIISKREDFWLWSVSRSLSFKTYDLSKTKRREKLSLFSAVTLSHFHFHRANNETTTNESTERNVPVLSLRPSSLSRGEEKGKRSDYVGKIQKCETFARWGKPTTTNLLFFDITRSSRIRCISRSLSKRSRAMHRRQRCVRNAPCSTSSSPWSRLGRIGSGQNRCFVTSTPPKKRARNPSLATRTRWRCTQSSHR